MKEQTIRRKRGDGKNLHGLECRNRCVADRRSDAGTARVIQRPIRCHGHIVVVAHEQFRRPLRIECAGTFEEHRNQNRLENRRIRSRVRIVITENINGFDAVHVDRHGARRAGLATIRKGWAR